MKISAIIIAAASAQKPLTQQIAEEDRQRVNVRFQKVNGENKSKLLSREIITINLMNNATDRVA